MKSMILEIMYILTGLVAIGTGIYALTDREHKTKFGTGIFWILFGLIFIGGKKIPPHIVGGLLVFMGILTALNRVGAGSQKNSSEEYRIEKSETIGNIIFFPALAIGIVAFAVITAGIGIPFVFSQGADPAIAGILGLTAGYCGTLLTPMAANFNVVPAAIMDMKNKNGVILAQVPVAIAMLVIHIVLMYFWAF